MISPATLYDVYLRVINHLGLWARDPAANLNEEGVVYLYQGPDADPLTLVPHPFVCERGYVRVDVAPSYDVNAMVREVRTCTTHSYEDDGPGSGVHCRMHPVVMDAQLAIWALGGREAVTTRRDPRMRQGFDERAYAAWDNMLARFCKTVQDYDQQLASSDTLNVGRIVTVPAGDGMADMVIKLRPGERRKRKRRK